MLGSATRIQKIGDICKCAILLQSQNCPCDFVHTHLTDDTYCHTQCIEGIRGIEALDEIEGIRRNVWMGIHAATGQQHIGNAALKQCLKDGSDSFLIQRLQIASCLVVEELPQIVSGIGSHRIGGSADEC